MTWQLVVCFVIYVLLLFTWMLFICVCYLFLLLAYLWVGLFALVGCLELWAA